MTDIDGQGWVLRTLVVALPCSVLSCLLTLWFASPSSPTMVPPTETDTDLLLARIDDLRQRVDAGFRSAERAPSPPVVERQAVGDDPLAKEMNGVLDRLERLLTIVRSGGADRSVALPRIAPINWNELESLDLLHQRDRESAARSTMLLTIAEVIERFGFPTRTVGTARGHYLQYTRTGPDGEADGEVAFQLTDGYVSHHEIRLSDR